MGSIVSHFLEEIPETGTYDAGIAARVEKICSNHTRLPTVALELFPSAPYTRTGIMTLPLWNDYRMAYVFFKSEFRGYKGTLVLIIKEFSMEALSVQLKRGDREIKIVEGETFSIRDNQGLDLGPFGSIPSAVAELDRVIARERQP